MNDDLSEVTENEVWGFISIVLILGVTKKRNVMIQEIWSPTSVHYQEFVTLIMSRNRFQQLSRYLAFDNVDTRRPSDTKFRKMENVFSQFQNNIRTAFEPDSHVTIDETLYAFRGNCPFRQFMPSKPAKYGLKYFCMCDVKSACLCNVEIYLGKDQTEQRQKDVGMNVVLRLVKSIEGTGRGVTTDNFFTSAPLSEKLWEKKLTLNGTLRKNKAVIPGQFSNGKGRDIHSTLFGFSKEKTLVSYVPKKNKTVVLLSTEHHSKKIIDDGPDSKRKPEIIHAYNATKGGVDTFDKIIGQYSCRRNTRRWPMNVFFFILDSAAYNTFVYYSCKNPAILEVNGPRQRRLHLEALGKALAEEQISDRIQSWKCNNFQGVTPLLKSTAIKHGFLSPKPTPQLDQRTQGRCYMCSRNRDRKSRNKCVTCSNFVCNEHAVSNSVLCCLCNQN